LAKFGSIVLLIWARPAVSRISCNYGLLIFNAESSIIHHSYKNLAQNFLAHDSRQ
jgi:hypothetical protein